MLGLILSDIHSRLENLQKIVDTIHNQSPDFCLLLGDLTNYGDSKVSDILDIINLPKYYAIPGNLDTWEILEEIESMGISIHGRKVKLERFNLVGSGGGKHNHPGQVLYSEEEIAKSLSKLLDKNSILATHMPPKETTIDLILNGQHRGSTAIRKVIEEKRPVLQLCGHIHEAIGEDNIGKTKCVNVGAVKDGNAALLKVGKEISIERIEV